MGSTEVQPIADNFVERCKTPPKMQFKGGEKKYSPSLKNIASVVNTALKFV